MPEPVYPTYVVEQPDYETEPMCVVTVNKPNSPVEYNYSSVEHVKCGEIPVTELIPVRSLDTEEQLTLRVSTITTALSEIETSMCIETGIKDKPEIKDCTGSEYRGRGKVSACDDTQLVMSDYPRDFMNYCFGVCEKTDSIYRSGIGWCRDCLHRLLWGYRVSCLVAIVIKDRSYGSDQYNEEWCVYTGLSGRPDEAV